MNAALFQQLRGLANVFKYSSKQSHKGILRKLVLIEQDVGEWIGVEKAKILSTQLLNGPHFSFS